MLTNPPIPYDLCVRDRILHLLTYLLMCSGGQHHVQHLVRGHAGGGPDRVLPAWGEHPRGGALRRLGHAHHPGHPHRGQEPHPGQGPVQSSVGSGLRLSWKSLFKSTSVFLSLTKLVPTFMNSVQKNIALLMLSTIIGEILYILHCFNV